MVARLSRGRVWWIRWYRDGRRHEESSGSEKRGVAQALLRTREGAVANGEPITAKMGKLRIDEALQDVVNDYKTNGKRSLDHVVRGVEKHLIPCFGGGGWRTSRRRTSGSYIAQRQATTTVTYAAYDIVQKDGSTKQIPARECTDEGASNAEINRELSILKRAYRLALQANKLLHAPHVPMLRESNARQGFFERAEFEDVRAALPEPVRPVATFAYLTGWRIQSEVLPLQWAQVDRRAQIIRLDPHTTKNSEGRTFPYASHPELVDLIDTLWTAHEALTKAGTICPSVFHRDGTPIREFRSAWRTACTAAGVPGKIPHDFRRTAVRNLVRAGVPERVAMQLTGHKTRSVFDRYDIVNEADLQTAVAKLADAGNSIAAGTEKGQSGTAGRVARFGAQRKSRIS